jgi:hypothetical protein
MDFSNDDDDHGTINVCIVTIDYTIKLDTALADVKGLLCRIETIWAKSR